MGLGVYEVAPPAATVAGWDVARFTESDGSTWAYESSVESEPGARSLRLRLPAADRDRQVSVALGAFRDGSVELLVDGEQADSSENYTGAGGGSFGVATTLVAGEGHTLELRIVRGGGDERPDGPGRREPDAVSLLSSGGKPPGERGRPG